MNTVDETKAAWVEELVLEPDGAVIVLRAFTVDELDTLVGDLLESL